MSIKMPCFQDLSFRCCHATGTMPVYPSGMMGYIPNPSEAAVSHDGMTGYRVQGNPHVDDASSASFNSQISGIFKVAGSS